MIKGLPSSLDFREEILFAQGIKSRIQEIRGTRDRRDNALPEARRAPPWQGRVSAALWARAPVLWTTCFPRGPLSPGAYKYPPGVFSLARSRALASFCNLVFRFVVVVFILLLVVVLAIRVKERECVKCCIEG